MAFQTEFSFTLPMGYIGSDGQLYKNGTMRLATAMDEIQVLSDMRTRNNDAYVVILLLSRVINQIGPETNITASTIENLFAARTAENLLKWILPRRGGSDRLSPGAAA